MNDRELLEAAAKAAGYTTGEGPWCNPSYFDGEKLVGEIGKWNPLKDDGDALRLAVRLNLHLSLRAFGEVVNGCDEIVIASHKWGEGVAHRGADPYAATRRAIVRAAAELSKQGA